MTGITKDNTVKKAEVEAEVIASQTCQGGRREASAIALFILRSTH